MWWWPWYDRVQAYRWSLRQQRRALSRVPWLLAIFLAFVAYVVLSAR